MESGQQRHGSFKTLLAFLFAGIALAAGLALWGLRRVYHRQYHVSAASQVVEMGAAIAAHLAEQPEVKSSGDVKSWQRFEDLLRSLCTVEPGLQYVAVTEDGVVLFHRQAETDADGLRPAVLPRTEQGGVELEHRRLRLGTNDVPVVTFTRSVPMDDGTVKTVEIAVRQETFARAASGPVAAATSMFKVAEITVALAFAFCAALVLWVMRREDVVERRRREQEHLAFAGAIASGVVHDFRNPLSSVKLDIQMLREEAQGGTPSAMQSIVELADHATQTAARMEEVLEQFLSLSSPHAEQEQSVDLGACVGECLRMLQPRLTRHGIGVETHFPAGSVVVRAYATSLRRAILNILANAEQHSPAKSRMIIRLETAGEYAHLDVEDSGPGVPRADRRRVFEMFVSGRPGGTGLGLFLAKTAVEKCGGTIEVVDSAQPGCCFRISLPLMPGVRLAGEEVGG